MRSGLITEAQFSAGVSSEDFFYNGILHFHKQILTLSTASLTNASQIIIVYLRLVNYSKNKKYMHAGCSNKTSYYIYLRQIGMCIQSN